MDATPIFEEKQKHTQWWGWALVFLLAAMCWFFLVLQVFGGTPIGTNPAPNWVIWLMCLLFGLGLPVFLKLITLTTRVTETHVTSRWWPLPGRTIRRSEITGVEAVELKPFRQWGGYGIRWRPRKGTAYLCKGGKAVRLELGGQPPFYIGTQDPEGLARACGIGGVFD